MAGPRRKPHLTLSASASLYARKSSKKKLREPVAVDAPPLSSSSSDEEEEKETGKIGTAKEESPRGPGHVTDSSVDDDGPRRGDIGRTEFKRPRQQNAQASRQASVGHGTLDLRQRTATKRANTDPDDDHSSVSSRSSKRMRPKGQPQSSSQASSQGSQLTGSQSFDRGRKEAPKVRYSRQASFASSGHSGTGSGKGRADNTPKEDSDSDEISEPESRPSFVRPPKHSPEAESPRKKFRHSKLTKVSSDEDEIESPGKKAQFKMPGEREKRQNEDTDAPVGSTVASLKSRSKWLLKRKPHLSSGKGKKSSVFGTLELEESTEPVVFKMPTVCDAEDQDQDPDPDHDDDVHLLDSLPSSDKSDDEGESEGTMEHESVVCPLCNEPLDDEVVQALLPAARHGNGSTGSSVRLNMLKFDEKMSFCAAHRQQTGKKLWASRGYPDIDWARLDGRIQRHHAHVRGVLEGTTPSHFRKVLQEQSSSSGGRMAGDNRRTTTLSTPGYYGQRGLRVMSEAIVQKFSQVLRRRAVEDPLIAARGYLQFVQDVLVPELAVQLIMEDMRVEAEGAREILTESAAMGELMHEEVDVVIDGEEENEEDEDYE